MLTLRALLTRLRAAFSEATDPVTGDHLTAGEHVSWLVQGVIRRWAFLGGTQVITILCWLIGIALPILLVWWNLLASDYAIILETIVGIAMFSQTKRDAVFIRMIVRMVKAVLRMARQNLRMEREHGDLLNAHSALLAEHSELLNAILARLPSPPEPPAASPAPTVPAVPVARSPAKRIPSKKA